ncbi:MAG: hypothetical protein AAF228_06290 [Pseudomonadota bacterium]
MIKNTLGLVIITFIWSLNISYVYASKINGGSQTGSYTTSFAPLIQTVLSGGFFQYEIATSDGSIEAAKRILEDPKDVSLAQLDAAYDVMKKHPGKIIMARKLANECLFAVSPDKRLSNWAKVEKFAQRLRIATASPQSGSAFTLKSVMQMDEKSNLAKSVKHIQYAETAKDAVKMVAKGEANLAFFVAYPDPNSSIFKYANGKKLNIIGVAHPNMRNLKTDQGDSIYAAGNIPVEKKGFISRKKVQTACTSTVILTGDPNSFSEDSRDRDNQIALVQILKEASKDSFRPKGDKWDRILSSVREISGNAATSLWTSGGELLEAVADNLDHKE